MYSAAQICFTQMEQPSTLDLSDAKNEAIQKKAKKKPKIWPANQKCKKRKKEKKKCKILLLFVTAVTWLINRIIALWQLWYKKFPNEAFWILYTDVQEDQNLSNSL